MRGQELTFADREERLAVNLSHQEIGYRMKRHQSVVSREVKRNGGNARYRAAAAQRRAEEQRRRPKVYKLAGCRRLHDAVAERLAEDYSPQQVSQQVSERLRKDFPDDPEIRVSHETIYETLFVQARGELRTQLTIALRSGRTARRPRRSARPKQARIAEAADRAVPGHGEGDLIVGKGGKSQILTLVERQTRFVLLSRVPYDRSTDRVAILLSQLVRRLPEQLVRSITWDQEAYSELHCQDRQQSPDLRRRGSRDADKRPSE